MSEFSEFLDRVSWVEKFFYYHLIKWMIIIVLTISIIGKISDPSDFFMMLHTIGFHRNLQIIMVISLVIFELVSVIYLLYKPQFGMILAIGLFCFFTIVTSVLYALGITQDCGCFGGLVSSEISISKIFQNIGFTIALVISVVYKNKYMKASL